MLALFLAVTQVRLVANLTAHANMMHARRLVCVQVKMRRSDPTLVFHQEERALGFTSRGRPELRVSDRSRMLYPQGRCSGTVTNCRKNLGTLPRRRFRVTPRRIHAEGATKQTTPAI